MALAKICWVEAEKGGPKTLPAGTHYVTAARFEQEKGRWPKEAWSLVMDFKEPLTVSRCVTADVHFLAPDAPKHLLNANDKFDLFEGSMCVAKGEIISDQRRTKES